MLSSRSAWLCCYDIERRPESAFDFCHHVLVKHPAWKIQRFDIACGALSVLGIVVWWLTGKGNVAIVFSILADGLAFCLRLLKAINIQKQKVHGPLLWVSLPAFWRP